MARTRLLRKAVTLPVQDDGTLRLAVVADTHSALHRAATPYLAALRPDAILHAGDIGRADVIDALAGVAPVHFVRGNIDERSPRHPDTLTLDVVSREGLVLRILLVHIAVDGARLRADVVRLAQSEGASLVVCGHSHVPFIGRDRGLTVFNPGSAGPRRFRLPILFGTIDVTPTEVRLGHVDCETGGAWSPPRG